jgi:hypothetical protein
MDQIYLTEAKVIALRKKYFKAADKHFVVLEAHRYGVHCMGSEGGILVLGWDEPVIVRHVATHLGQKLNPPPLEKEQQ